MQCVVCSDRPMVTTLWPAAAVYIWSQPSLTAASPFALRVHARYRYRMIAAGIWVDIGSGNEWVLHIKCNHCFSGATVNRLLLL